MYVTQLCVLNITIDLFNERNQKMEEKLNGSFPVVSPEYLHQW